MRRGAAILLATALWAGPCLAQSANTLSDTDLSKDVENPVTRQITLPLRYEADFDDGPYSATKSNFQINQAVVPFLLNDDWALITRTKFPAIVEPPKKLGGHWMGGLSNAYTTFFLSPAHGPGFYWGVGPVLYFPTATNSVGVNKWGSGPSVAFLKKDDGPWVLGAVINNIWSFGGPTTSSDRTNQLLLNPVVDYNFPNGWSLGSSPNITTNWIAGGGKWTVPLGGGVGKALRIEGQAVKFDLDAYYNAIRPKAASDTWLLQATMTLVFPR